MNKTRIVFMGTPVFGKEMLATLVENGFNVVAVVCQPDKLVGRKQVLTYCETKQYALANNIPVIQPLKIREDYQAVIDADPQLIVTCAYGQIIPEALLNYPKLGCVNIHASLLPKLRGGAPIQHAIIDGYDKTGITIMEMAKKMDAGDIISQNELTIEDSDTYFSLHDKLIQKAKELLLATLPSILDHSYTPIRQKEDEVTFGYNISKEEEHIDLTKSYKEVFDQIRGLSEVPGCYGIVEDKKVKFLSVKSSTETSDLADGTIIFYGKGLAIVVKNRLMVIDQLQLEGKNKMSAKDFRNGAGRNWNNVLCS